MKLGRLVSRKRGNKRTDFSVDLDKNRKSRLDLAVDRRIMQISIL